MLVLEAKKVPKLSAPPITRSVNSSTYTDSYLCMEDGAIGVSAGSYATISTKTLCWSSLRSSFRSEMVSQDRFSSPTGYKPFTTLYGRRGPASSHTRSNKTSTTNTATSILKCTRPARKEYTSISRSSGNGSSFRSGTERPAISVQST